MDLLFGTYRSPDHEPESFGVNEPTAGTYLGHMLRPFLRRRRAADLPGRQEPEGREPAHGVSKAPGAPTWGLPSRPAYDQRP